MSSAPSNLIASTRRAIPLRMRADLIVEHIEYQRGNYYVIKDPVSLKYYRLGPEHYRVLEARPPDLVHEARELLHVFQDRVRNRQPAERVLDDLLVLGLRFPQRRVAVPEAPRELLLVEPRERRVHRVFQPAERRGHGVCRSGQDFLALLSQALKQLEAA